MARQLVSIALFGPVALSGGFRVQKAPESSSWAEERLSSSDTLKQLSSMLMSLRPTSAFNPSASGLSGRTGSGRQSSTARMQWKPLGKNKDTSWEKDADMPDLYPSVLRFPKTESYRGKITVGLGPGMQPSEFDFPGPSWTNGGVSLLSKVHITVPMGISMEPTTDPNCPGRFVVTSIRDGSSGQRAGIKVGDLIRATTAMAINWKVESEKIQNDFGAKPSSSRAVYWTDESPRGNLIKACQSNDKSAGGPGEATVVVERLIGKIEGNQFTEVKAPEATVAKAAKEPNSFEIGKETDTAASKTVEVPKETEVKPKLDDVSTMEAEIAALEAEIAASQEKIRSFDPSAGKDEQK